MFKPLSANLPRLSKFLQPGNFFKSQSSAIKFFEGRTPARIFNSVKEGSFAEASTEASTQASPAEADFNSEVSSGQPSLPENWPTRLAALGLLVGITFSASLWTNFNRTLPACPLIVLPQAEVINSLTFTITVLSAACLVMGTSRKLHVASLVLAVSLSILLDLNRFQPWVYEYLIIISLSSAKPSSTAGADNRLKYVSLAVMSIYLFSGLEKLNWYFLTRMGPWLAGFSIAPTISFEQYPLAMIASAVMAVGEIAICPLLFMKRTRKFGILAAVLMHLSILSILGPRGLNINAAAWPWNIFQLLLVFGCFMQLPYSGPSLLRLNWQGNRRGACILLVCSLIIPMLGLLQIADPYPAFALYSGDVPHGRLTLGDCTFRRLPAHLRSLCRFNGQNRLWQLDMTTWALCETSAPAYASKYCLIRMAEQFAHCYQTEPLILEIASFPKWSRSAENERIRFNTGTSTALESEHFTREPAAQ